MLDATYRLIRPLLFTLDPENAHELTLKLAPKLCGLIPNRRPPAGIERTFAGLKCPSPVGLAAGLDKGGVGLPLWEKLGFGFVEVGTVTPRPQPGNPKPRIHRLADLRALINSMGFPSEGADVVAVRLRALRESGRWPSIPVGINLGKNKATSEDDAAKDFALVAEALGELSDYLVVNVSSPNTPGLRALQSTEPLKRILEAVLEKAHGKPVFVKISPDLSREDLVDSISASCEAGAAGIVATNTTLTRPQVPEVHKATKGGLSGEPLFGASFEMIKQASELCASRNVPLVGVGGVSSGDQARSYLDVGCSAVQLYTGMIFEGPGLPSRINGELAG